MAKKPVSVQIAEKYSQVNEMGFGQIVRFDDPDLPNGMPTNGNGASSLRHDGVIAKYYIIRKFYANGTVKLLSGGHHIDYDAHDVEKFPDTGGMTGQALVAWQLYGFSPEQARARTNTKSTIPLSVRRQLQNEPCAFWGVKDRVEIDHKYGREDQENHPSEPSLKDFQPVCKMANNKKREACARCKRTGKRFDASGFGFMSGWVEGGEKFDSAGPGCHGCFLFDPREFRRKISS